MPLIQPIDKTLEIISMINAGNEREAANACGINCDSNVKGDSFLDKVVTVASLIENDRPSNNGGILVTPDTKTISNKEIVADALELPYALAESVSMIVANSISALSTLSEDSEITSEDEETGESDAPLSSDEMDNIKHNMTTGLVAVKDALIDVFANTSKIHIKVCDMMKKALSENGSSKELYVSLTGNAISGAGIIYAISKMNEFSNENSDNIAEALDTSNVFMRADNILFSTLNLEENLIKLYLNMRKFNNGVVNILESSEMPSSDSATSLASASEFLTIAVDQIAKDILENNNGAYASSDEVKNTFEKGVACIAALYDEFLQDNCKTSQSSNDDNTNPQE